MSGEGIALKVHTEGLLIKWEGDPPPDCWEVDPIGHPKCLEVLKVSSDGPPVILWRRDGTD